jgi:2-polyprenyl-3-methyl-5-hydroxy-6-metoxy-1,4-benzoquinol methylase
MTGSVDKENLWAYRKRLEFITSALLDGITGVSPEVLRVLDIGCGNGTQLALPLARARFNVTGIDLDRSSIEHAAHLAEDLPNARFLCTPVEGVADGPYDAVILSEVLEHVEEPRDLLMAGVRNMKRGGVAIVTTPNGYGEFELDWWLFRMFRLQRVVDRISKSGKIAVGSTDNEENGHIQFFTHRRLKQIFDECGLNVWRERGASLLAGPMAGHTLGRSERFIEWNTRVTDRLPIGLASAWYFALRRKEGEVARA